MKQTNDSQVFVRQMTLPQFRALIISEYSNQRRNDKHSVAYANFAMNKDDNTHVFVDSYTRKEIFAHFISNVSNDARLLRLLSFTPYRNVQIIGESFGDDNYQDY